MAAPYLSLLLLALQSSASDEHAIRRAGDGSVLSTSAGVASSGTAFHAPPLVPILALPPQAGWPVSLLAGSEPPAQPVVADLDGDGTMEVVLHLRDPNDPFNTSLLRVYGPQGNLLPGWPQRFPTFVNGHPLVGDTDGDGDMEIFAGTHAFHHDGSSLSGWPKSLILGCAFDPIQVTTLADLDADGEMEVIGIHAQGVLVAPCEQRAKLYVWDGSGNSLPGFPIDLPKVAGPNSATLRQPAVGDLDGDGDLEVLVLGLYQHTSNGDIAEVYAYHHNGIHVAGWKRRIWEGPFISFHLLHAPVLVNLDGDAADEVVIAHNLVAAGAEVVVLDDDGSTLAGWPKLLPEPLSVGTAVPLSAGDLDGGGDMEIVAVRPISASSPGGKSLQVDVWKADGTPVLGWPRSLAGHDLSYDFMTGFWNLANWSEPILADVIGLGLPQVLLASRVGGSHRILVWRADGILLSPPTLLLPATSFAGALLATDLDLDGDVELGAITQLAGGSGNGVELHFWDLPAARAPDDPWPTWGHDAQRTNRVQ